MTIPEFAPNGVLPSFVGDQPAESSCRSPYRASMLEVVERFCTSPQRAELLLGLNEYRKLLFTGGFVSGSQWIDGSFVENVEERRRRSPSDIDVVTLFNRPIRYQATPSSWHFDYQNRIFPKYFDTKKMKPLYGCDTYAIDLDSGGGALIRNTTYWFGLFSDVRNSNQKKGIVELPLSADAAEYLVVEQAVRRKFHV
ncbi:hypothetical protein L0V05_02890 [Tabrizicola sp. J26]|uniref:DUF6932 family protein n=1 Tax=Alitabrizicola rongguiensis TaxID=2909234 RepID=UPI001F2FC262|nr:hypothetical protein [Tabrizicola rongguiensis]MCF1707756.1 hypothetical protein [Tabrizicola rongguiensis]